MTDHDDPFVLLRRLAGDPQPSAAEEQAALSALEDAIAAERLSHRRRAWWFVPAAAVAVLVVIVGLAVVSRPEAAAAALSDIAQAARRAGPLDVPSGSFIYRESESTDLVVRPGSDLGLDRDRVAYLLPTRRREWRQPDSGFFQLETTATMPTFFDQETRKAYEAHNGRSLDRVGEVVVERFTDVTDPVLDTDWPTDPGDLKAAMTASLAQGGDTRPYEVQIFDLAADLLRDVTDPQLRAAVLQVLATVPVDLVDRHSDGTIVIALEDPGPPATRQALTIAADGTLAAETLTWLDADPTIGVPADTVVSHTTYRPVRIVHQLPELPDR